MVDHIIIWKRLLAGTLFFIISFFFQTGASFAEWKCRPGSPCFYTEFDPASWKIENELNYEEVYKNFEYFEVIFNKGCEEITVKKYRKGTVETLKKYRLAVDGTLQGLPN